MGSHKMNKCHVRCILTEKSLSRLNFEEFSSNSSVKVKSKLCKQTLWWQLLAPLLWLTACGVKETMVVEFASFKGIQLRAWKTARLLLYDIK